MTSVQNVIFQRRSTSKYQPDYVIDQETLAQLVSLAGYSPSAYNLQNWRFIAVTTPEAKAQLRVAAYGQPQVEAASATFIVCGQLAAHKALEQRLSKSVNTGVIPQSIADSWVGAASQSHEGNDQLQRDEAIRSASLAAMTLMLAAEEMGLATGAMGGFDGEQLKQHFPLNEDDLPVMLITIGKAAKGNWAQKARRPLKEILTVI
ncbi:nitroreductase family protein [Oceanospirillum linum]|uniref:Nitroreductase family protein n=1 Tax=Oceanospirillum linum TaxID=966 RepID=A0A1T1HCL4_OCELI|nr:nitroreductase family protein [Oceanospirillum linum]OOV87601.1 nitroreductase family protein [Oceanospirillum linum]SEF93136.1 Nitroreductase [Oleiphilus messinensis]SMP12337.1 Nitroreductase [Oceanospirillum linum]